MDRRLQEYGDAHGTVTQNSRNAQGKMKVPWCTVILLSNSCGLGL